MPIRSNWSLAREGMLELHGDYTDIEITIRPMNS
jgi:hypothetical protein